MALEMSSSRVLDWAALFHSERKEKKEEKCFIKSFDKNETSPFSFQNNIERFCSKILLVVGSFFGVQRYRVDIQLKNFCKLAEGLKEKNIKKYVKTSDRKIGDVFSELFELTNYLQDRGKKKECTSEVSSLQKFRERVRKKCSHVATSLIQKKVKDCSIYFSDTDKGKIIFSGKPDFIVEKEPGFIVEEEIVNTYGILDKDLRCAVLKEVYKEKLPAIEAWIQKRFDSWTNSEILFQKKSDQIKQMLDLAMGRDDALGCFKKEIDGVFERISQSKILQVVQNLPKERLLETIHVQLSKDKKIEIEINAQKLVSDIFSVEDEPQGLMKKLIEKHIKQIIKEKNEIQESLLLNIVAEYEKGFTITVGKNVKFCEKELNESEEFYNTFVGQVQSFLADIGEKSVRQCLDCLEKKHGELLSKISTDKRISDRACVVHVLLKNKKFLKDLDEEITKEKRFDATRGAPALLNLYKIIETSEKIEEKFKEDKAVEKLVLDVRKDCERIGRAISRVFVEIKNTTVANGGILLANTKVGQVIQGRASDDGKKQGEQMRCVTQIVQAMPMAVKSALVGAAFGFMTEFSINGAIRGAFLGAGSSLIPLAVTEIARKAELKYYIPEALGVAAGLFLLVGPKNMYSCLSGIVPSFGSNEVCGWNPLCGAKKVGAAFMDGVKVKNVGDVLWLL